MIDDLQCKQTAEMIYIRHHDGLIIESIGKTHLLTYEEACHNAANDEDQSKVGVVCIIYRMSV